MRTETEAATRIGQSLAALLLTAALLQSTPAQAGSHGGARVHDGEGVQGAGFHGGGGFPGGGFHGRPGGFHAGAPGLPHGGFHNSEFHAHGFPHNEFHAHEHGICSAPIKPQSRTNKPRINDIAVSTSAA